jgi:hypothetical protein
LGLNDRIKTASHWQESQTLMNKYLAILNEKTAYIVLLCLLITYFCIATNFSFNLNITLYSIAVIFPLVFTIRESFRRRDNVIKLLSIFKSSLNAAFYCFMNNKKLDEENKHYAAGNLYDISLLFFKALKGEQYDSETVRNKLADTFDFINRNRDVISNSVALKIIRMLKDVHESMENTVGLKMHGTPVSLRAYCLVFIYMFPFIFIPAMYHDLNGTLPWIVYALSVIHGFILISLYNVQDDMEDPFDQIGLDDIKLEEFHFRKSADPVASAS